MRFDSVRIYVWLRHHLWVCFVLLTASFVAFGCLTVDLVRLIAANTELVFSYGVRALMDGGAQQFVELWLGALLAMGLYMVFKFCEQVLLHAFAGTPIPKDSTHD